MGLNIASNCLTVMEVASLHFPIKQTLLCIELSRLKVHDAYVCNCGEVNYRI
ncbi:hypothetical protein DSO57_1014616, partial [Entomophthora muscae]